MRCYQLHGAAIDARILISKHQLFSVMNVGYPSVCSHEAMLFLLLNCSFRLQDVTKSC